LTIVKDDDYMNATTRLISAKMPELSTRNHTCQWSISSKNSEEIYSTSLGSGATFNIKVKFMNFCEISKRKKTSTYSIVMLQNR